MILNSKTSNCFSLIVASLIGLMPFINPGNSFAQDFNTLDPETAQAETKLIKKVLEKQMDAWNQGNLEMFMKTYWKSKSLTFSGGGTTTRGWQETLDRYKSGYAPPKEMGKLGFDGLEITLLETRTAMVLGDWHLTFADQTKRNGNFTLLMHKLDNQWRIIHDHSSERKPAQVPAADQADQESR